MQKSFSFGWFEAMRDEVFVNNWNYSTFDGSLWWNGIGFLERNLIYLRVERWIFLGWSKVMNLGQKVKDWTEI